MSGRAIVGPTRSESGWQRRLRTVAWAGASPQDPRRPGRHRRPARPRTGGRSVPAVHSDLQPSNLARTIPRSADRSAIRCASSARCWRLPD